MTPPHSLILKRGLRCSVLLGLIAGVAASAQEPAELPAEKPKSTPGMQDSAGFWPSPRMTEYALRRWSAQVANEYELGEEQTQALEEMMLRRWPKWMKQNRRLIQPVVNEFMENRIAPEPPSPEQISKWAGRALKAFGSARDELREAQDEFRRTLSPSQKMRFDVDVTKMNVGMEVFEQKIKTWQEGQYATREFWDRPHWMPKETTNGKASPDPSAKGGGTELAGTEPQTVPLDRWESFVADYIRRYSFDQEQTTSAWSIMGDLRAQAEAHKDRHREEYEQIEQRVAQAKDGDRRNWVDRRKFLDNRIDRLFEELKDRLERLLTDAQRNSAERNSASS